MALRTPFRRLALTRLGSRAFHSTPRVSIRVGDDIPETGGLFENSAAAKISLADEFKSGDGYIIGVPGAFTGTCSSKHIPSYLNSPKLKDAGKVFVLSVNDPFVMKAWAERLDPASQTSIRWVADPTAVFTKSLAMEFDGAAAVLGGTRSQRFALKIVNGKVAAVHLEADATAADAAEDDPVALIRIVVVAHSFDRRCGLFRVSALSTSAATISSSTRKRKAAETTISPASPNKKYVVSAVESLAAPPTPVTTHGMDSDEDFMSQLSSDDDIMQDSADDMSTAEYDDDDFDEPDPDFGLLPKQLYKKNSPGHVVAFTVYKPIDIREQQDGMIAEVNMILDMGKEDAAIMLRHFRWNKERLLEDYMDHPEKVLEAAGLNSSTNDLPKLEAVPGFVCDICCEDEEGLETFAMKCGHRYCVHCYRRYLTQKIRDEGEAARIQCPSDGCGRSLDSRSLDLLVTSDLTGRYHELLNRTYVEDKDIFKWCPAPDCPNAVECGIKKKDLDKVVPTVECSCGFRFCFGCPNPDHQPAPCDLVRKWLKKCADDSETANWINANTKECPKCQSTIEKNGGCNHMTCRKCRYEFCWMCMGLWSEHGTSWYNCNRYEEKSGHEARDAQTKSRTSLARYLHYYNRYANHEQSARLDRDIAAKTEKKMVQLQTTSGMSWIEVQYLNAASQALQTCRQTLKWTYAFAFYLTKTNLTEIFEDNQKDLEIAVENLSEMFEKPIQELSNSKLKVDIMDKTSYCSKRRLILLEDTADNLARVVIQFGINSTRLCPPCSCNTSLVLRWLTLSMHFAMVEVVSQRFFQDGAQSDNEAHGQTYRDADAKLTRRPHFKLPDVTIQGRGQSVVLPLGRGEVAVRGVLILESEAPFFVQRPI
ncbi:RING finger protein [Cordyceps militaris CM01]|uniref:RBR-type E3 ubiquitin transferase n=1 Tax=Cordyceps militaris (strain CM01) TaxID=983644 RepID=G3JI01_CORMM|nr:RING finger protein [Cordyceps militaris CM01]EGX91804.1 RING finger protein [Cordyceps militaris CM01]